MIDNLPLLLKDGANPALRYQKSRSRCSELAHIIINHFKDEIDILVHIPRVATLIRYYDYRLVAEYLFAWKNQKKNVLDVFNHLIDAANVVIANKQRYQLAFTRLTDTAAILEKPTVSFTERLDNIFSSTSQQLLIYLRDERYKEPLMMLVEDVASAFGTFIEQQYDLPGLNAVVRQGLVRKWWLPNGTAVVSKRENVQKKDRFYRECINYDVLLQRFGEHPVVICNPANPAESINVQIAQPFAIIYDGYSGSRYALSAHVQGIPLEDVFLTEHIDTVRDRHLVHYRLLLDMLYQHGILWGDMSPRNILMQQRGHEVTYTLLDFEKTRIFDEPIPVAQRLEHCRGQICIEELGVLCSQEEVQSCFKGYFDPSEWDLESDAPLPFPPRPDIADILQGRGINAVSLGTFNTLDREIMGVRSPDYDPHTQVRRFPGHLGFKVEHYLSCAGSTDASDYDRKTTEVLIAAKQQGCFDDIVTLLDNMTTALESAYLKTEFMHILQGGFSGAITPPSQEINALKQILDVFYQTRHIDRAYQYLITQWQAVYRSD